MFLVLFACQIITVVKQVILDYRGSLRAGQLEKELEDSRIGAMLSQMQPHFLYNVLNSIYQLCEVNPKTAQDAIEKFSDYLRNNMASLEQKEGIPFQEEYSHVKTYLSLEQIRFPGKLRFAPWESFRQCSLRTRWARILHKEPAPGFAGHTGRGRLRRRAGKAVG